MASALDFTSQVALVFGARTGLATGAHATEFIYVAAE
jgi:hypothetical protein